MKTTEQTAETQATAEELGPDLYRSVTHRSCGHTHTGPSWNSREAALRYGQYTLTHCVCGTCGRR